VTDVPHFSYPFRFASPLAAVTEQDSLDEIADCVLVTLLCPQGYRAELPEFGLPDPTFSSPTVDVDVMRRTVEFWEPRALSTFDSQPDAVDELIARVQTTVSLRTEE
jgi:hypothetical protein